MDDVAKDATGEPDAADVVTRVHKTMDRIDRMAGVASTNTNGTQNNATWNINAGGVGVWISATAALFCLLVAAFAVYIADDAKDEVRAERLSREIMNKWTAQEVTAIRSYITTGKLAPMSPPPVQPEEK